MENLPQSLWRNLYKWEFVKGCKPPTHALKDNLTLNNPCSRLVQIYFELQPLSI